MILRRSVPEIRISRFAQCKGGFIGKGLGVGLDSRFEANEGRNAGVAQLVEQRIRNAKVGGSTPLAGTSH
jgi:hypothetical protein